MNHQSDQKTLVYLMDELLMSRIELSELAGVPERTVYRWLSGKHRVPTSLLNLLHIMIGLELTPTTVIEALRHINDQ